MTFPNVRSEVAGTQGSNSTSWTLSYPATISAGDLLVVGIGRDGASGTGAITDFSSLYDQAGASSSCRGLVFVKVATGSETGTFSYAPGASEQGAWRVAAFKDWWGTISGGVEAGGTASGTSTTPSTGMPDPGSFDPSWGTEDTRWRAQTAFDDGRTGVTAYPSGYTINQNSDASGGSGGAGIGGASIDSASASVNPGTFTVSRSVGWVAWVVAIRPAATVENHNGVLTATGGGVRTGTGRKGALVTATATGGGVATFLAEASSEYATGILADSPIAYWRLDEPSGSFVDEVSGLLGSAVGTLTRAVTGPFTGSEAVRFGGTSSDGIDVSDDDALDLGAFPLSIEFWARRIEDVSEEQTLLRKGTGGYGVIFMAATNDIALNVPGTGPEARRGAETTDTDWHHFVLTRAGNGFGVDDILIYRDASESHVDLANNGFADNTGTLEIGRESGWAGFNGEIAELALYDYVLTPTQVADHFALGGGVASEEHDGALAATGAGVFGTAGEKAASAALAATGGGTASTDQATGRSVALAATGAGVLTPDVSTERVGQLAATGGGVATVPATTARPGILTATGGGTATFDASSAENHDGILAATGAGVAAFQATTERSAGLAATGAGVNVTAATTDRPAALAATGGGVATFAGEADDGSNDRSGIIAATGGGVASLSAESARYGAMLLSGGGVLTTEAATERFGALAATGGGTASFAGSTAENHNGALAATGAGEATFAAIAGRTVGLVSTGGGAWTTSDDTSRLAALLVTGGGSWSPPFVGEHFGVLAATGGGTVSLVGGDPPTGLSEGITVSVGFVPGLGVSVGLDAAITASASSTAQGVGVTLDPELSAEVSLE
jgi:hypothetical protein